MNADLLASYPNAECPDCGHPIPSEANEGDACQNCGHVFWLNRPDDDAIRVVIVVDGGNVQSVYSDNPNVVVEMLDFDNLEAEDAVLPDNPHRDAGEARLGEVAKAYKQVY